MFSEILSIGLHEMQTTNEKNKLWKEEIINEYGNSMNYPRKKKKNIRKHLLIKYNIACHFDKTYGFFDGM